MSYLEIKNEKVRVLSLSHRKCGIGDWKEQRWYTEKVRWTKPRYLPFPPLKVLWKKSIGKCHFSVILSFLAPIFAFFIVFCLFPSPNTLLSCYFYQILCLDVVAIHVLSIWHQDMWKKIHWVFLVNWISNIFLPIFGIFQCIPPIFSLMYAV